MFFNFVLENLFACLALSVMLYSIALQFIHIKFKKNSTKQMATLLKVENRFGLKKATVLFSYEGDEYQSSALSLKQDLGHYKEIEILVNSLEMVKFRNPSWLRRKLNRYPLLEKKYPKISLIDQYTTIYHFALIIFCLIILSFL